MYYRPTVSGAGAQAGLSLFVEPGDLRASGALEVEASQPWLVRISRGAEPLLWGRGKARARGAWFLRGAALTGPALLPPIRASEARRAARRRRWLELFAEGLGRGGALRPGAWQLTLLAQSASDPAALGSSGPIGGPGSVREVARALERPALFEESWGSAGSSILVPLREPSGVHASRVQAWREHARDQTLPPLLVGRVPALDVNLLLDGHDRLHAAALEGVSPDVITLWQPDLRGARDTSTVGRGRAVERRSGGERRSGARLTSAPRDWRATAVVTARSRVSSRPRWLREVRDRLSVLGVAAPDEHPMLARTAGNGDQSP